MADSPWTFGWTAVAGIAAAVAGLATSVLAGLTGWLALSTRQLARETDADVKATWRPVVLAPTGSRVVLDSDDGALRIKVPLTNVGKGPALNVTSEVHLFDRRTNAYAHGVVIPGAERTVRLTLPAFNPADTTDRSFIRAILTYEDLGHAVHRSTMLFLLKGEPPWDGSPWIDVRAASIRTNVEDAPTEQEIVEWREMQHKTEGLVFP